ncbi:MAG: class I SAM-dependent methyltransferase [Bryobacteraceae bacterium]
MANTNIVRTREFFHEYASGFNSIYSNRNTLANRFINHMFRKSMEVRYRRTLEGCRPVQGKRVLDIGCGPGHYGIALARAGAVEVVGLDFAEGMIKLARQQAEAAGVAAKCTFMTKDFYTYEPQTPFDYVVVMGVMDYVPDPKPLIQRVLSMTRDRAFLSFPVAGGLLAWQRKLRYRTRCPLFLYTRTEVEALFENIEGFQTVIEQIARDFFVQVRRKHQTETKSA